LQDSISPNEIKGKWFEIGRKRNWFEPNAAKNVQATYTPTGLDTFDVVNYEVVGNRERTISGKAWHDQSSCLKRNSPGGCFHVQFFWPFSSPLWVLILERECLVVSGSDTRYVWIMCRHAKMNRTDYNRILHILKKTHGFDTEKIVETPQNYIREPAYELEADQQNPFSPLLSKY